ncbi:MAG TPA: di-heme oxidoredictase family protein, partial [Solirubrobacterales bacterium]
MRRIKGRLHRLLITNGLLLLLLAAPLVFAAVEAPAGFDDLTNGFVSQAQFDIDKELFEEVEVIEDGLGPVYNAQACRECHQNPVTGSSSQVSELRAARFDGFSYQDPPGGSLINDRAINAKIQERVSGSDNVTTFRMSLNTLGDGFVEAIANSTLEAIRAAQPSSLRGQIILVPVLEKPGQTRIGRFGWKNQHASLLSFSADAYLNEMGITSPLAPNENTSYGASVAAFDDVPDPEEAPTPAEPFGPDVEAFARFMRATKVPPRDTQLAATSDAIAGQNLFNSIGCQHCHTPTITTAPPGTVINGGAMVVPAALGDKIIHPYSDFLLHNVGTGDGIIPNGGSSTRNKLRTPPLWGLRSRSRLMHDGENFTRNNAILRHTNEAEPVIQNYINLSLTQKNQLVT